MGAFNIQEEDEEELKDSNVGFSDMQKHAKKLTQDSNIHEISPTRVSTHMNQPSAQITDNLLNDTRS